MPEKNNQNYLHGAAVLTISVIVIKILGFIYKIPLYNILGPEGTAHFTSAYNIYNVLLTLSTAGLPVALSRLIAEANALNRPMQVKRVFRVAFATFIVLGALGSLVMYLFPYELAGFIGNVEAAQSVWALSPAVLLVCVLSAYRGYAQGHSNMTPTSVSQVIEVAVKVLFGLIIAWLLSRAGKSLPVISAGAIVGVPLGTVAACLYIISKKRRIDRVFYRPTARPDVPDKSVDIFRRLIKIGVPIALGSSVMSIITLVDTKITYNRLQTAAGFTYTKSYEMFGTYSYAMALFNLPAAFITPLAISVVPAISASLAHRNVAGARNIAESSLRIATVVALPMGIGLSVLSEPIMNVLYWGKTSSEGGSLLLIMGFASYFVCMSLITTAILQAYGSERLPVLSMVLGGLVKIAVNWVLVGNPDINIFGAPVGTLCCYGVMFALNFIFIGKVTRGGPSLGKILARPVISSAVMGISAWAAYSIVFNLLRAPAMGRLEMSIALFAGICVGMLLYLMMVIFSRAITLEDMKLIPRGEKLAKLLRIK